MTEQQRIAFDTAVATERADKRRKHRESRIRHSLSNTRRELDEMKRDPDGICVGVTIMAAVDCKTCDFCAAQDGRVIPLGECTVDRLPPWKECTSEDGCRCCFSGVTSTSHPELPLWRPIVIRGHNARRTIKRPRPFPHVFHLVLSIASVFLCFGLWIPVYLLHYAFSRGNRR